MFLFFSACFFSDPADPISILLFSDHALTFQFLYFITFENFLIGI